MTDSTSPLALAARALEALPGEAEGAQATVARERSLLLRFARSRPTQATAVDDLTVSVTVAREGRAGAATTNRTDPDSLAACARSATDAAEAAARAQAAPFPGFPAPEPAPTHEGHDAATARLDAAGGGEALVRAFAGCAEAGVEAHGVWTTAEVETAIASTSGLAAADRVTDALMKVTAIAPNGRSGLATQAAVAAAALDPSGLARRAAEKAAYPGEAVRLVPGEYPVVFEAPAVADLLDWAGALAFGGLAYAEERSALNGRLGTRVAASAINLSDSPRFRGTLPRAFDAEGVPKRPLPLIQDGVAHRVVHDTHSASVAGAHSTGHALAPAGAGVPPRPTNLVLVGGGAASEAELCAGIERGVYVTRLWYTNPVRPRETLITGVTRDGTFLIEDGRVTRPLADLRLTDSVLGILGRVRALGARPVLVGGGHWYGRRFATGVVCPPLQASAVRFTA
jgi:predicted Zn-dependent protease